jgi:hypothetical protein
MRTASGLACAALTLVVAACAGPAAPAVSSSASATASATSSGAPSSTPAATAALPTVDLTFSGPFAFTAKGSTGRCDLGKDSTGAVTTFGFQATDADYPGLGDGFFVSEDGGGSVVLKLLAGSGGLNTGQGVTVSPDHKSATLDADLGNGEQVVGSIVCP